MRLIPFLGFLALCQAWQISIEPTGEEGIVRASVSNIFEKPMTFCIWGSPLDAHSDVFKANLFDIASPSGDSAEYIGIIAKRHPTLSDFVTLQPGQTLQTTLNLFKGYYFPVVGEYKVSVNTKVKIHFGEVEMSFISEELSSWDFESMTSNALGVEIAHPLPAPYWGEPSNETSGNLGNPAPKTNCNSGTQVSQINTAGSNAITATTQGINYLPTSCASTLRFYVEWFGACDSNRYTTVKNCLSRVRSGLQASYPVDCAGSSCTANTYAYVYPTDTTHTVYVCGYFWRVPSTNCRLDSQPGTLIHEMSHFNNVCSTRDVTYGVANCRELARTRPQDAVQNADNYCFYTDSCPS
jgi:peptidyl-Lys metalloendopeptidase